MTEKVYIGYSRFKDFIHIFGRKLGVDTLSEYTSTVHTIELTSAYNPQSILSKEIDGIYRKLGEVPDIDDKINLVNIILNDIKGNVY